MWKSPGIYYGRYTLINKKKKKKKKKNRQICCPLFSGVVELLPWYHVITAHYSSTWIVWILPWLQCLPGDGCVQTISNMKWYVYLVFLFKDNDLLYRQPAYVWSTLCMCLPWLLHLNTILKYFLFVRTGCKCPSDDNGSFGSATEKKQARVFLSSFQLLPHFLHRISF